MMKRLLSPPFSVPELPRGGKRGLRDSKAAYSPHHLIFFIMCTDLKRLGCRRQWYRGNATKGRHGRRRKLLLKRPKRRRRRVVRGPSMSSSNNPKHLGCRRSCVCRSQDIKQFNAITALILLRRAYFVESLSSLLQINFVNLRRGGAAWNSGLPSSS